MLEAQPDPALGEIEPHPTRGVTGVKAAASRSDGLELPAQSALEEARASASSISDSRGPKTLHAAFPSDHQHPKHDRGLLECQPPLSTAPAFAGAHHRSRPSNSAPAANFKAKQLGPDRRARRIGPRVAVTSKRFNSNSHQEQLSKRRLRSWTGVESPAAINVAVES
jgi:hypothetical protein